MRNTLLFGESVSHFRITGKLAAGRFIVYRSAGTGGSQLYRPASDGSGTGEALWESDQHVHVTDWTPDGRSLVVNRQGAIQPSNKCEELTELV